MERAILDTSTLIDLDRASRHPGDEWAENTAGNYGIYMNHFHEITISGFTVFEYLDGLYRNGQQRKIDEFVADAREKLEVISPSYTSFDIGAQISAALAKRGLPIGPVDCSIAGIAIQHEFVLVTSNTAHFERVRDAGFALKLTDWREIAPSN